MKKLICPAAVIVLLGAACSPHFHLDFLGQERMEETTLLPSPSENKILLLDVEGIISSAPPAGLFDREGDLASRVYARLDRASRDPRVKAVILRLDTPGGEVTASDIVYHEILRFREKTRRPVVALMMGVAASGGYYIASACDVILAHPSTITGSIGVISIFPTVRELMDKVGVRVNVIKSREMKDAGGPFRDMTEEEKTLFQGIIDEYYESFLEIVRKGRKDVLSREELRQAADGRVYTARQALDLKLIDGIGYFDEALEKALDLASLKEADVVGYTYYPKSETNIYATTLSESPRLEKKSLESVMAALKSGFYYLWLPQVR